MPVETHAARLAPGTCPATDVWNDFQNGQVEQVVLDDLAQHLEICSRCLAALQELSSGDEDRVSMQAGSPFLEEDNFRRLQERAVQLPVNPHSSADCESFSARDDSRLPTRLGRFQVRGLLGSGGFGRVYLADDPLLRRAVAIKVPRWALFGTIAEKSDFLKEARLAAALDHPGIVPIFDVLADEAGRDLIVMKHIEGRTLSAIRRSQAIAPEQAVRWLVEVARAVHYAHQRSFVHRDLKPSNILIDVSGRPLVTDFGLVVDLRATEGDAVGRGGTPAYMAPEQVRHDVPAIGPTTDVWALGVMLVELLTGRSPFFAKSRAEQFDRILNAQPELTDVQDTALRQILLQCLEKDPDARPATALKLAEQLEDWRHRQNLHSTKLPLRTKLLTACVLVVSVAGAAYFWSSRDSATPSNSQVNRAANSIASSEFNKATDETTPRTEPPNPESIRTEPKASDPAQRRAMATLYAADMKQAFEANSVGDTDRLKELLKGQIPAEGQPDLRGFEWHYLNQTLIPPHRTKNFIAWMGHIICVSPDGEHLAVGGPFAVKLLNAKTLEVEDTLWVLGEEVRALAYSPDGTQLAGTGHRGNVILWSIPEKKLILQHKAFSANGWGIAFTPDGQRLVACSGDGSIKVWRVNGVELELLHNLKTDIQSTGGQSCLDLAPNGTLLATGSRAPDQVVFWNLESGQRVGQWNSPGGVKSLHFTADNQRLIVGVGSRALLTLSTRDPANLSEEWDVPRSRPAQEARLSPNEVFVAVGGKEGEIQICRTPPTWPNRPNTLLPNAVVKTWPAHSPHLMSLKYLSDSNQLVSTGDDGKLHLWDLRDAVTLERLKQPIVKHMSQKRVAKFVPSNWSIAAMSRSPLLLVADDRGVHIREIDSDEVVQTIEEAQSEADAPASNYIDLAASASGRVALSRSDGRVTWWDHVGQTSSRAIRHELGPFDHNNAEIALSPDGRWLVFGQEHRHVHEIHDLNGGVAKQQIPEVPVIGYRFTSDGRRLIFNNHLNIRCHDLETQTTVFDVKAHTSLFKALALDSQDSLIATGSFNHEIKLWDASTGQLRRTFPPSIAPTTALAFSPDGRSLISSDTSKTHKIWNVETGQHMGDLPASNLWSDQLEFSSDGRHLLFRNTSREYLLFRMPRQNTAN